MFEPELFDPFDTYSFPDMEQGGLTATIYRCRKCGALVSGLDLDVHIAWHKEGASR
jgi:hypothetical protein